MKKNYLFSIMVCCAFSMTSLAQDYGFDHSMGTYTALSAPMSVNGSTVWDDDEWSATIGFDFFLFGVKYTEVIVGDGYLNFDVNGDVYISGIGTDMVDRGDLATESPISTQLEGNAPNRIFKVEWKNAGFYHGDISDSISFQIWLHESTDEVSFHYGESNVGDINVAFDGETGPYVGLVDDPSNEYYHLEGDASNPTMNPNFNTVQLTSMPPDGIIYLFGEPGLGISDHATTAFKVYPNPTRDMVFISPESSRTTPKQVQVFDIAGKLVMDLNPSGVKEGRIQLDVSTLDQGVYFLQLTTNEGIQTQRIVKQ